MTATRKTVREALAVAISADMTSAKAVYDHMPATLDGGDPAVLVLSASSERNASTVAGFSVNFFFEIHNLVLYASASDGWTEEDAEDELDTLEYELALFMDDSTNRKGTNWKSIRYAGRSIIGKATIGGITYQDEIIPLMVAVP